jgi:hypothetical protein
MHPQRCGRRGFHPQRWGIGEERRMERGNHCRGSGRGGGVRKTGEQEGELLQGGNMAVGEGRQRGSRRWIFQGERNVLEASEDEIVGGGKGHGDLGGEPGDGVGNAFRTRIPQPDGVAAIRVECRANVPAVKGMG